MEVNIPRNLRNCRGFIGTRYLRIASILSQSAFTPSSKIMWPRNLISGLQNWHFAVLTVKPALVCLPRTKCDVDVL